MVCTDDDSDDDDMEVEVLPDAPSTRVHTRRVETCSPAVGTANGQGDFGGTSQCDRELVTESAELAYSGLDPSPGAPPPHVADEASVSSVRFFMRLILFFAILNSFQSTDTTVLENMNF